MADLSITATSVIGNANEVKTAGASITAGQAVYVDTADLVQLSDCDSGAALKTVYGIAVNSALTGQPVGIQRYGNITIGGTVAAGVIYILSGTAGGICPSSDATTGDTICIIGVATTSAIIAINIYNSGVVAA